MPILIIDPLVSTKIFIAIFVLGLLWSLRRKNYAELFPPRLTQELKGLAILAVVFSHVGYFLATDHRFLFPLSILAGVGVDLFLFLSGYGLTISALKNKLSAGKFYYKYFLKLLIPFWLVTFCLLCLDFFWLHLVYTWPYIIRSWFGIFTRADLFLDINSPFWFLTPLLFYYLIFPWIFCKQHPWLTAVIIYVGSYFVLQLNLPVSSGVLDLYQLHFLAFPLGVAVAALFSKFGYVKDSLAIKRGFIFAKLKPLVGLEIILAKLRTPGVFWQSLKIIKQLAYYAVLIGWLGLIGYLAYHSGVGKSLGTERLISLITVGLIVGFFVINKFESKLLVWFGFYAYEIYLIHWPLMSRYDFLFKWLPGWLAMILYLGLFLALAGGLKKISDKIQRLKILN
ncbi:MAG: acyltransferase family protein [Candidatus Buchananbacteria bacterium]